MHAYVDDSTIIVSDNGKTVMVAAQDPAFAPLREYLVEEQGQDFDAVRSIVFMSRHLVETYGRATTTTTTTTTTWN